jgi:L-threonine kinase
MTIKITTYAKVGELLQGTFGKSQPFLVSNTSSRLFKTSTVASTNPINQGMKLGSKAKQAIELFCALIDDKNLTPPGNQIYFNQQRNFKIGKGLSSSSTDILGILSALNAIYKTNFPKKYLYNLASKIEPTDPCLDLDSLLFNQKTGEIIDTFAPIPYSMLYFDSNPKIKIDTIKTTQNRKYSENQVLEFQKLYANLKQSAENKNYALFFECTTKSAVINETILPKKNFTLLLDFATENNCGLFVAHSGTFMGLLIEPHRLPLIDLKTKDFVAKHWNTPLFIE